MSPFRTRSPGLTSTDPITPPVFQLRVADWLYCKLPTKFMEDVMSPRTTGTVISSGCGSVRLPSVFRAPVKREQEASRTAARQKAPLRRNFRKMRADDFLLRSMV